MNGSLRIVSLVPSLTELLCELGLSAQLVGRTGFCIHPKRVVASIPKVGGTKNVDLDKLFALAPTHVVVNVDENEKPTVDAIAARGIEIVVTHPLRVDDNFALYDAFGRRFGCVERAALLSRRLAAALAAARARRWDACDVLYLIWKKPWMTVSADTYIADALAQVGMIALAPDSDRRYPEVDFAHFELDRCEYVLFSSEPFRFRAPHLQEFAAEHRRDLRTLHLIDGEMTSWYGSRAIEGIRYLRRFREQLEAAR